MTHTPGPWTARDKGDYGDFDGNSRVIRGDDMRIAVVQHNGRDYDDANANLIAAAPEILEMLKQTQTTICKYECGKLDPGEHWKECGEMQALIAKAEGQVN